MLTDRSLFAITLNCDSSVPSNYTLGALDEVPYWAFCLIRNDLVEEIMEQGVYSRYEEV